MIDRAGLLVNSGAARLNQIAQQFSSDLQSALQRIGQMHHIMQIGILEPVVSHILIRYFPPRPHLILMFTFASLESRLSIMALF